MTVMKPKINRKGDETKASNYDTCLTPSYALEPLLPYLQKFNTIWEPACGQLHLVNALLEGGVGEVIATDLYRTKDNYFDLDLKWWDWEASVTNPPYSLKFKWLQRSYDLGKPFALLLPVEVIGAAKCQAMMKKYGAEIMLLDSRVNFHMPEMGWGGDGPQFPVLWYCWNLLPERLMFGTIKQAKKNWEEKNKEIILRDKERVSREKEEKKKQKEMDKENV